MGVELQAGARLDGAPVRRLGLWAGARLSEDLSLGLGTRISPREDLDLVGVEVSRSQLNLELGLERSLHLRLEAGVGLARYFQRGLPVAVSVPPTVGLQLSRPFPLAGALLLPGLGLSAELARTDLVVDGELSRTISPVALSGGLRIQQNMGKKDGT
jgi:hypothetical protein